MHLRLCIDGFNPFRLFVATYSYWPVILTIYNLLSRMRIRLRFMFLSIIIPDPNSSDQNIDVYFQSLINDLK